MVINLFYAFFTSHCDPAEELSEGSADFLDGAFWNVDIFNQWYNENR